MKVIQMQNWEIEALANNQKSCIRLPLNPQPQKDEYEMWRWKDCCWMDSGLGFPESGMEDHSPYQPGDIVEVWNADLYIRILKVYVERLWDITDKSAQMEGCSSVFSSAALGSRWDIEPVEAYAKHWDRKANGVFETWNLNPWVEVIEFESISKEEADAAADCKFCFGKIRTSFQCNVQILRDDDVVVELPVPVIRCPYCGRILEKSVEDMLGI